MVMGWKQGPETVAEEACMVKRNLVKVLNSQCVHLEMVREFLAVRRWEISPWETSGEAAGDDTEEECGQEVPLKHLPRATEEKQLC